MPIISPPRDSLPRFPLNAETTAKIRIGKYKEREGRTTDHDYLKVQVRKPSLDLQNLVDWELLFALGKSAREKHLNWLLSVRFVSGVSTIILLSPISFFQKMTPILTARFRRLPRPSHLAPRPTLGSTCRGKT